MIAPPLLPPKDPFTCEGGAFLILCNKLGQYSIWPEGISIPRGWDQIGPRGERSVCEAWIDHHWTVERSSSEYEQSCLSVAALSDDVLRSCTTVIDLFESQVRRTPAAIAIETKDGALSYKALADQADRLAQTLINRDIGPGSIVAICLSRSLAAVVTIVAILKTGAAYIALDATMPNARRRFIMEDLRPALLVTSTLLAPNFFDERRCMIVLDSDAFRRELTADVKPLSRSGRHGQINSNCPIYIMYTSGSTGKPKGVILTQKALVDSILARIEYYGDSILGLPVTAPFHFDISFAQLFWPMCSGARAVLVDRLEDLSTQDTVSRDRITHLMLPVSAYEILLETISVDSLPALRTVILGGEPLTSKLVRRHARHYPHAALFNEYGPTEAAIWSTVAAIDVDADTPPPIGKPIFCADAHVLNDLLEPCPTNTVGALYLSGAGLAQGYWGKPSLTSMCFVANPFGSEPGARMYRTGDLAVFDSRGDLFFQGRCDNQIKIHGFRVEPGEIESALVEHPQVRQAAVVLKESGPSGSGLVAHITVHAEAPSSIDTGILREHLTARLPDYMIPAAYIVWSELPLTANSKIDRRALQEHAPPKTTRDTMAYSTETQALVAGIFAELFDIDQVDQTDNFYCLGGHSLLAARLVTRLKARLKRELTISDIFAHPTVEDMARLIDARRPYDETSDVAYDPAGIDKPFPLTPVQEAYWLGRQRLVPLGEVACHVYTELKLPSLDLDRFTRVWRAAIARHHMLRAVIAPDGTQRILRFVEPYVIAFLDATAKTAPEAERLVLSMRQEMANQVLPSDRWPLFDIRVTRVSNFDWRIHISIDALILDRESMNWLLEEVFENYHGRHISPAPAESSLSFRDYVLHLERARAMLPADVRKYWEERLDTLPPAPMLPLASESSRLTSSRFTRRHADLDAPTWKSLKARAATAQITPSVVLLTAYAEIVGTWSQSDDFTLNLTVADRRPIHPDLTTMLGVFTNLLPLEVRGARRGSFLERAQALQSQLARDLDNRLLSGVEFQRMRARRDGDPQAVLLPIVLTSFLGERPISLPREVEAVYTLTQTPQTWLDNQIHEQDGVLVINWDSPENLFPLGLPETMIAAYVQLLCDLAQRPESWTEQNRSLIPAHERELIASVNDTSGPLPNNLLHHGICPIAKERACKTAIVAQNRTISYSELGQRVRAAASALRTVLRDEDVLVAVIMEKGIEQIVGALAILELGRAFLPISAEQPDHRIQTILEQAGVRVAITQPSIRRDADWQRRVSIVVINPDIEPPSESAACAGTPRNVSPDDLCYVIYTSGSTGMPKGVAISHRAALNTLTDIVERFSISENDRVLWISSFEFDLSIFDIFATLLAGGTVVIPPFGANRDPAALINAVSQHGVTIWNSVPAIADLALLAEVGGRGHLATLRLVMLSGDWIPLELPERIRRFAPYAQVVSLGGATEASIWSVVYPIEDVAPSAASIPYGRPLRNQTFRILKPDLSPCPIYVPGRLFIGGHGLANGYWNDPRHTGDLFIVDPLTRERLYDTGDFGRYLPNGDIEFLGRTDNQIKINGFRVETSEIESTLNRYRGVQSSIVSFQRSQNRQMLIAYVVCTDSIVTDDDLRHWLEGRLPRYMIPAKYVFIDAIPLTRNGKVDHKALKAIYEALPLVTISQPVSEMEKELCRAVSSVLGLALVGRDDHFFSLGGDSLAAIKLAIELKKAGLRLEPKDIFLTPVVKDMAERILPRQKE